jgi:hypothetical protein
VTIDGRHLTDQELMDVLDGALGGAAPRHAAACASCGERLAEAREGLALARAADVPEPPALYWQAFPRRVAARLEAAGPSPRRWRGWLIPTFATAVALAAAVAIVPRHAPEAPPSPAHALAAWSALPPAEADPGLPVLQAVASDPDPTLECGGLAECLADLSDEESQDLVQMLRPTVKDGSL